MEEQYIRESKIIDKTEEEKERELIISILKARKELEQASRNFEYAEEELIDYYTYQIKANRSKLDYLIKKAKSKGTSLNMINRIELKYNRAI